MFSVSSYSTNYGKENIYIYIKEGFVRYTTSLIKLTICVGEIWQPNSNYLFVVINNTCI